jgi:hypothetical protein
LQQVQILTFASGVPKNSVGVISSSAAYAFCGRMAALAEASRPVFLFFRLNSVAGLISLIAGSDDFKSLTEPFLPVNEAVVPDFVVRPKSFSGRSPARRITI